MAIYQHILLAVDFAPDSEVVIQRARELAQLHGARLSLVHVTEYVPVDMANELVLPQEMELDQELNELAVKRLAEVAERIGIAAADQHVLQGNTRGEIQRLAEETKADLIVLGSHGRQGIQRLLGSTANGVLHGAPCDVLAVRIRDE
ncbi:MAG TPA: universal stress protein [Gammaproteobacteria bacterium]|nr:universal stress protein [Gammaproteobacteria bacterium]